MSTGVYRQGRRGFIKAIGGLGLALAYSIMEDMGGSIDLTSPLDDVSRTGTRITLQLPQADYGTAFQV